MPSRDTSDPLTTHRHDHAQTDGNERGSSLPRGREARSPAQVPWRGWYDIVWRIKNAVTRDRVLIVAGGVAFYAILSLFPMLTAFVALYGLFSDPEDTLRLLDWMDGALPDAMRDVLEDQLTQIVEAPSNTLTATSIIAIAVAFWSANGGVKGLIEAMNVAYGEREERSFLKLNMLAMSMTLSAMLLVMLLLALSAVLPAVVAAFPGAGIRDTVLIWGRWPFLALILMLGLAVLYRFGPDRRAPRWQWITPGALVSGLGLLLMTHAFGIYTARFADLGATYGSLATFVAIMLWLWLASVVVIIGAEINAETEHQTAQDSTIGADRPLGERNAVMADHIGPPIEKSSAEKPPPQR